MRDVRRCASATGIILITYIHLLCTHQPMKRDPTHSLPMIRLGRHWRDTPTADAFQLSIGHSLATLLLRHRRLARTQLSGLGFGFPSTPG